MRFQHVVVVGLGWLLTVVVGCTSGESPRISGLSSFVPSFAFDSQVETSEVTEQAKVEGQLEDNGSSVVGSPERTRPSLQEILPKLPWKRNLSEHNLGLHGPDAMVPLTEKEKAELGVSDWSRTNSLKSRFRIGKARMSKGSNFRMRPVQANEEELNEFRSIDAELEGLYATNQGSAARGLDALLADADAMSALELDAFAEDSTEMIVLRAIPDVRAFQQPDQQSPASLSLIRPRDRSLKVGDDVSIRSLPFVGENQEAPSVEPTRGLPASSLSWRERLQKYPVTQDQRSSSVATLVQPEQTELRILRMTAVTPEDRSIRIAPQVSIRSIGVPTVVRGVHPDALQIEHPLSIEVADQAQSNRRTNSSGQYSPEKTLSR
jgi:hypothetical protein